MSIIRTLSFLSLVGCGGYMSDVQSTGPTDGLVEPTDSSSSSTSSSTHTSTQTTETTTPVVCYSGGDIQIAIDNAANGDTLYICAGTHLVNLVMTKNVTLDVEDSAIATILDGQNFGPVIVVQADRSFTAHNLELTNGNGFGTQGGGVEAGEAVFIELTGCDVHDNTGMIGGVQGPYNGSTNLTDTRIADNTGEYAGGLGIGGGSLDIVEISGNHATLRGGGAWVYPFQGPTITDTTVSGNTTDGIGGGIALDWASYWHGGLIELNTADYGGGIGLVSTGSVGVMDAIVRNNTARIAGGGFYNSTSIGGPMAIRDTELLGNTAPLGGGLYIQQTADNMSSIDMTNVIVDANTADDGAGFALDGIDVTLADSTVSANVAATSGGGFALLTGATLYATNIDVGSAPYGNLPEDVDISGVPYDYDGAVALDCDAVCQ